MDICNVFIAGTVMEVKQERPQGRMTFVVISSNSQLMVDGKKEPLKVAVTAEQVALNTVEPQRGDYVVIANADYFEEHREGCTFGLYAHFPKTVSVAAHNEGVVNAKDI